MPKIYEYLGLIFFFYANEHLPIHIHITKAERESKIELIFENGKLKDVVIKKVKGREPLTSDELKDAVKFIKRYYTGIADKWNDFFVLRTKVKCEVISKKI
jgi:hypothetical protein